MGITKDVNQIDFMIKMLEEEVENLDNIITKYKVTQDDYALVANLAGMKGALSAYINHILELRKLA